MIVGSRRARLAAAPVRATVYHLTQSDFDAFDDRLIGSCEDNHDNSNLGHWFAVDPSWGDGDFAAGMRKIEVEVDMEKVLVLEIDEFSRICRRVSGRSSFDDMRASLIADGFDGIAIMETDGHVSQYVVFQAVDIVSLRELRPLPKPSALSL